MGVRIIFVVCLLFLFSCGEKKPSPQVNKKAESVKNAIEISGLVIQANMVSVSTFLNGDKIPFARTTNDCKKAIAIGQPAWCYADTLNNKGILYNYYAVCDKRGVQKEGNKLTHQKATILLGAQEIKWNQLFDMNDCAEKGPMGNIYNLNYLNLWIQDTLIQDQEKLSPCLIIYYKTNEINIKNVNKGNGFHLLDIY